MKLIQICKQLDEAGWTTKKEAFVRIDYDDAMEICDNSTEDVASLYGFDMEEIRDSYAGGDDDNALAVDDAEMLEQTIFANESECLMFITDVIRFKRKFYIVIDHRAQVDDVSAVSQKSLKPMQIMDKLLSLGADFQDDVQIVDEFDKRHADAYAIGLDLVDALEDTLTFDASTEL